MREIILICCLNVLFIEILMKIIKISIYKFITEYQKEIELTREEQEVKDTMDIYKSVNDPMLTPEIFNICFKIALVVSFGIDFLSIWICVKYFSVIAASTLYLNIYLFYGLYILLTLMKNSINNYKYIKLYRKYKNN